MAGHQYSGNIFGLAKVGQVFVISGTSSPGAERFDISLKNGKPDGVNVALHLSVRFRDQIIVRNSLVNHQWGAEEREQNLDAKASRMPIIPGATFKVYIFLGNDRFLVAVNDATYCSYKYRLPISEIKTIEVNKDVATVSQVDHRSTFPVPWPNILRDSPQFDFSNDTPRRYRAGHQITIVGVPLGKTHGQFVVRMFETDAVNKQALHFNPRFVPYNFVAINSHKDDLTWRNEERHTVFPFAIHTQFKLTIVLAASEFRFSVNDKPLATYSYANNLVLSRLLGLKVEGKDGVRVKIISVDHVAT